ncbi:MAG: GTPase Era [Gammaproteobacteria bacterium TMED222]|jgi:GTP-binding protein Era|nr:MAG: GTPase Era [Gammaproteobacteria bacterium TMED222]RZP00010.1 MAG: GTPase Era [Gammaproteobacteria bacterium]|tara:strand:- start:1616 stop:2512 length:897 start_codon:yes stop_codon:yes gene_type:complete
MNNKKFGFVSISGRTNVGKSTLINSLIEKKIAITSRKPQTTRNRILGISTSQESQIVYLDTPGFHTGHKRALNKYMNKLAKHCYEEVDLVVFVVDRFKWLKEEKNILDSLKELNKPIILAINKIDRLEKKEELLPLISEIKQKFDFLAVIPISALRKKNLENLTNEITKKLPEGPFHFPENSVTEFSENFFISEIIREKAINRLGDELPYRLNVGIDKVERKKGLITIYANIIVESSSQKGIILGKGGSMIKAIGTSARKDLEAEMKRKINLQLFVKVSKKWTNNLNLMNKFGYGDNF